MVKFSIILAIGCLTGLMAVAGAGAEPLVRIQVDPGGGPLLLYWTDSGTDRIQRANLDGSGVEDLVTGLRNPSGLALDAGAGKLYWADGGTDKIQRSNLNGSEVEDLVTTGLRNPSGLALDAAAGKLYWTDYGTDRIQRSNLDGTEVEELITGLHSPLGLALDAAAGKLYWADYGTDKIQRANLNGTEVEDLVTTGLRVPRGLALDASAGKLYWTDSGTDKIQRSNLNGSEVENLITSGLDVPRGLALDAAGGKLYWSDSGTDKIQRSNLNGSGVEDVVTGLHTPARLALGPIAIAAPNRAPTLAGLADLGATAGDTLIIAAVGRDLDGDALSYAAVSSDSAVATVGVADSLLTVFALAAGPATITVTARDSGGLEATQTFVLTVQARNRAPLALAFLYWIDRGAGRIQRSSADGSGVEDLVAGLDEPVALALDGPGGRIYWADGGTGRIQRVSLDGFFVEEVVTGLEDPGGLALDTAKLYWTDGGTGRIQRSNLDGTEVEEVATGLEDPGGLALDVTAGKLYWSDRAAGMIQRSNLAGSEVEEVVTDLEAPVALALDTTSGQLYWTDGGTGKIQRSNLDGTEVEEVVAGLQEPGGLALDPSAGKVYWADGAGKIQRSNLDGTEVEEVVTGLDAPCGLALGPGLPAQTLRLAQAAVRVKVARHFRDPEGGELTYTAAADSAIVRVSVADSLVTIAPRALGRTTIAVTAADAQGLTTTQPIAVTVQPRNRGPKARTLGSQRVRLGGSVLVDLSPVFSDPNGDRLRYSASSSNEAVATVAIEGTGVRIAAQTEGQATIMVKARDPWGLEATQAFGLTVEPKTPSPPPKTPPKPPPAETSPPPTPPPTPRPPQPPPPPTPPPGPNQVPVFNEGASTSRSVAENTRANQNIQHPVSATDGDGHRLTYSLEGQDADAFTIDTRNGQLRTRSGVTYDYETKPRYSVSVKAEDGHGGSSTIPVFVNLNDVNEPPSFTSDAAFEAAENQSLAGRVAAEDADNADGITGYAITGGVDRDLLEIDSAGALTFKDAPDFEDPADNGRNNSYIVVVTATGGAGGRAMTAAQTITVTVTNESEPPGKPDAPTLTSPRPTYLVIRWTAPENSGGTPITGYDLRSRLDGKPSYVHATVTTGTATTVQNMPPGTAVEVQVRAINDDGPGEWSDSGFGSVQPNKLPTFDEASPVRSFAENTGAGQDVGEPLHVTDDYTGSGMVFSLEGTDAGSFDIVAVSGGRHGQLQTKEGVTYDNETKNSYSVTVKVVDPQGGSATVDATIELINADEPPRKPGTPRVEASTMTSLTLGWTAPENTGRPAISGYDVQYRTGAGTFTVVNYDGTDTRATVGSLTANTEYELQVRARNADGDGGWSDPVSGTTSDNQPPVFTVDGRFEVEENETTAGDVVADDADAEDSITGYEITGGADQDQFEITSGNTLGFRAAPDFDRPADLASTVPASEAGDNEYIVEITATSGAGDRVKTTALPIVVTVTNLLEPPGKIDMPAASASVFVRALSVEWSVPENDGPDIDRYEVQYRIADSGDAFATGRLSFYSTAVDQKKADVHYLKTNTGYEVQVRGANAEGPGEWSESAFGSTYNGPPFVTPLGDRTLTFEGAAEMVPLWYGFRDGQDMAWFAASSSDDAVATARVAGWYLTIRPVAVGNTSIEITGSDNYGETAAQTINVTVQAATLPDPTAAFDADNEDLTIRFTDRFEAGETRAYDVRVRQQTPLEVLGKVRVGYKGDYITGCIEQSNPETSAADISIMTSVGVEPGTTYEADYRYRGEPCTERDYSPGPWSRTVEYTTSGTSAFDVEFVFKNFTPTAAKKAVFDAAEARWESIIRNSLPDYTVGDEVVDDLRIEVELSPQALGSAAANVKILRFESHLPAVSWMKFDETFYGSLSDERLKSVILHEMAHALGFSATAHRWKHYLRGRRKYDRIGDEIPDTHFLGPLATAAFNDAGGGDYAGAKTPVENGVTRLTSGSVDHHWRESVLGDELMTSLLDFDEAAPLSAVTIQALADIGYVVDVTQADPYTLPETSGSEGASVRAEAAEASGQAIPFRCVVEDPAETENVEEPDASPGVLESTILEMRTLGGQ